ncbi:MAG TPA: N-6 DNA methylase [Thermoanaerobaculia bacterium]|jgi:type I restriction-modification system DNA methylase subunit|nr:N-6 DNA methylase [Thermoanaerobaculia bacterium]
MNERKTEDLVEARLRRCGYYLPNSGVVVEKQRSDTPRIQKLLENASKQGGGVGKPEFLIHSSSHPDFLIVIECKASPQRHASATRDHYSAYAVDGALLYASFLSKEFDVLAIAVSGQTEATYRISHFFHVRGTPKAVGFAGARDVLPIDEYYESFLHSEPKFRQDYDALLDYSRILNNTLQARKITEAQRGFLISGILIALQSKAFKDSFRSHRTGKQIARNLLSTIHEEFESASLPAERRENLVQAFSFISESPALVEDREFFIELIVDIDSNVNAFMKTHKYYDTVGQFYVEFLRYANNDKGLGIVLTPRHVAELFAELGEVNRNSVAFDNCCGTAGLLIAAMEAMIRDAGPDRRIQQRVKNQQLFGIEFQPNVYALAISNMILHGDGKTNIYRGDCFEDAEPLVAPHRPTVGLLNPPYKNKTVKHDREELEFVFNNLECLQQDGKCVAIVPITCATAPTGVIAELKRRLMEHHTLEAVMSMPVELFHNSKTTVVTCIMVFTAHRPHLKGKKTWFGYWRHDGLIKTKHRGRVDANGAWPQIKAHWLNAYRNREAIRGFSVTREVGPFDEWCAEAYLDTDYATITEGSLVAFAKNYVITGAMLRHDTKDGATDDEENE